MAPIRPPSGTLRRVLAQGLVDAEVTQAIGAGARHADG
jgi:hypothetical protein